MKFLKKGKFKILEKLQEILGKEKVLLEEEELLSYSYDASSLIRKPLAVILPEKKEEVVEVLKWIKKHQIPLTPRGSGTSTTGSALAHSAGIILCLSKMNRILELDEEERVVRVEPGVINGELKSYLKKFRLFYPPDPASMNFSTIGGNVATGAGGPRGLKYGTTKDYVLALEVVLPGGEVLKTGPTTLKGVVPYNLTPIFIGSEGTLGVFTEIFLKVLPLPEKRVLFLSFHSLEEEPLELLSQMLKRGLTPASSEFVDKTSLKALVQIQKVKELLPLDSLTKALFFVEFDGTHLEIKDLVPKIERFYFEKGIRVIKAEKEEEIESLWEIRRTLAPALKVLGSLKIADDVVVPRKFMKIFLTEIRKLEKESKLPIVCFGHAGDGNFHVNLLFEEEKKEIAKEVREKILKKVLELSGTISGEHGLGYTKRTYINWELSSLQIEIMKKIKKIFDPDNLLNPWVKLPD